MKRAFAADLWSFFVRVGSASVGFTFLRWILEADLEIR